MYTFILYAFMFTYIMVLANPKYTPCGTLCIDNL